MTHGWSIKMTAQYSPEDIECLKYAQLQKLAKKHGIKANQKGAKLVSELILLLCKPKEKSVSTSSTPSLTDENTVPSTQTKSPTPSDEHTSKQTTPPSNSSSQSEPRRSTYLLPRNSLPNTPTILKNRRSEFTQYDIITASEEFKRIVSRITTDSSQENSNSVSPTNLQQNTAAFNPASPETQSIEVDKKNSEDKADPLEANKTNNLANGNKQTSGSHAMECSEMQIGTEEGLFYHLDDSLKVPEIPSVDIGIKATEEIFTHDTPADRNQVQERITPNAAVDHYSEEQMTPEDGMDIDDHEMTTLTHAEMLEDNLVDSILGIADTSRFKENEKTTPIHEKTPDVRKHSVTEKTDDMVVDDMIDPAASLDLQEKIIAIIQTDETGSVDNQLKEGTTPNTDLVDIMNGSHDKSQLDVTSSQDAEKSRRDTYSLDSSTVLHNISTIDPEPRPSVQPDNSTTGYQPMNEPDTNTEQSYASKTSQPPNQATDDWMKALDERLTKAVQDEDIESRIEKKLSSLTSDNNKKHTSRTPNFKMLHARHFSKMTDITQIVDRRNKMAAASKSPFSNRNLSQDKNTASSLAKRPLSSQKNGGSGPKIVKPIRGGIRPISNENGVQRPPHSPARLINRTTPGKPLLSSKSSPVKNMNRTPGRPLPSVNRNTGSSLHRSTISSALKKTPTKSDSPLSKSPGRKALFTIGAGRPKSAAVNSTETRRTALKSRHSKLEIGSKPGPKVALNRTSELRRLAALKENENKRSQITMTNRKI